MRLQPPRFSAEASPCNCKADPIGCLKNMFVDIVQRGRIDNGQAPAARPVFLRQHGVVQGKFSIRKDIPERLRVGLFKGTEYDVWIRFSSDLPFGSDLASTLGLAIKVFGVQGEKVFPAGSYASTHDFVLQNHDVFFVRNAAEMCEFTYAGVVKNDYDSYLAAHPETAHILKDMQKVVPSVFASEYWAILPFRFGEDGYTKYKVETEQVSGGPFKEPDGLNPTYLRRDLVERLRTGPVKLRFLLQLRTNADAMPLDDATARWSETESPYVPVADLILPKQDVQARGTDSYGENLAFNIWHALPEHSPVGSLAEARKVVYDASASLRRDVNGVPIAEPAEARTVGTWPAGRDRLIVRASIHPSIGIARVGNSQGHFFGPEVVEPLLVSGVARDEAGALKRQACRFRIYGHNAAGEIVAELTPESAEISWTVHVANKKAAWYRFPMAMDIPEAGSVRPELRNKDISGLARKKLVLDSGEIRIAGPNGPVKKLLSNGAFREKAFEVCLGEVQTDESGHLVFVAGYGISASPEGKPIWDGTDAGFPNADGWYDDICDGPVTASVRIDGQVVPVDGAWIVSAPPNYAPGILGVRTLYDLLVDVYTQAGIFPAPNRVSFKKDVFPILKRMSDLQWVNAGYAAEFGWRGRHDFGDPKYIDILSSSAKEWEEHRRQVLIAFRDPTATDNNPRPWPWLYGDAMDIPAAATPRQNSALTPTQYRILAQWAEGDFVEDWSTEPGPRTLQDVPLQDQPRMLDRASLESCLADAFHPGCELTWPMRHMSIYEKPFRIRLREEPDGEYGKELTVTDVFRVGGPLFGQSPGDLTRWMGLPWQMDTAMCRSGYEPQYDPYLPSFWPAHVPNQVLSKEKYLLATSSSISERERIAAFQERKQWTDDLSGSPLKQMSEMVTKFPEMAVVEPQPGKDPFPSQIFVGSLPPSKEAQAQERIPEVEPVSPLLRRAGWKSHEQFQQFIEAVRGVVDRRGHSE